MLAAFLAGGIAAAFPECVGEPYEDGSGTPYLSLIGQPILIYGADRAALTRALERALARGVSRPSITEDMFKTTHDAANRAVVKAVARADLNLSAMSPNGVSAISPNRMQNGSRLTQLRSPEVILGLEYD